MNAFAHYTRPLGAVFLGLLYKENLVDMHNLLPQGILGDADVTSSIDMHRGLVVLFGVSWRKVPGGSRCTHLGLI